MIHNRKFRTCRRIRWASICVSSHEAGAQKSYRLGNDSESLRTGTTAQQKKSRATSIWPVLAPLLQACRFQAATLMRRFIEGARLVARGAQ